VYCETAVKNSNTLNSIQQTRSKQIVSVKLWKKTCNKFWYFWRSNNTFRDGVLFRKNGN